MDGLTPEEIEKQFEEYTAESKAIWNSNLPREKKIEKAFQLLSVPQRVAKAQLAKARRPDREELREKIEDIELYPFHLHSWCAHKTSLKRHTHLTPRGVDQILALFRSEEEIKQEAVSGEVGVDQRMANIGYGSSEALKRS